MSSRAGVLALICLLAGAGFLHAGDWESFAARNSSADDAALIEVILSLNTEDQVNVAAAIGRRDEPFAGDVLEAIASARGTMPLYRTEYLLRVLLGALLDPSLPPAALALRTSANKDALSLLLANYSGIADPQLRELLLRAAGTLGEPSLAGLLARQADDLSEKLRRQAGGLSPMDEALLLTVLSLMRETPSRDFLEPCLAVIRVSRSVPVVASARAAARVSAALP